jgi:oligoendopeptidase F
VRSAEVEAVLAQFADLARAPCETYETLTYADLRFPTIADEAGQPVRLSMARYGRLLESSDRRVRRDAFTGLSETFRPILNTLGVTLAAEVRARVAGARMRGYASSLEGGLQPEGISTDVYRNLIATVNANLPLLHRYVALRRRILGIADQRYYDLSAPLLPSVDLAVSYPEAVQTITEALAPLGADYAEALQQAFHDRWIDVYENVGKRSGAYSGGSYATAPFILLNYQGRVDDLFILAYEIGHSMHSFFTRRTQPFVYGEAAIFAAEVASTLNEVLLTHYLCTAREDPLLRKQLKPSCLGGKTIVAGLVRVDHVADVRLLAAGIIR